VDYTSTSGKSDANMEHSNSQGSNDTIKIPPQFAPYFKPKVKPTLCYCQSYRVRTVMENLEKSWNFKMVISRPGKVMEKS